MKQKLMLFFSLCIFLLSSCSSSDKNNVIDTNDINSKKINVQSNLLAGGHIIDCPDILVFDNYVYDKESKEVSILCKDPVCNHTADYNGNSDCLLLKHINCLQVYDNNILCVASPVSNNIYSLDPETGTLSVYYTAGVPVHAFRLYGEHNIIIHSADLGFYTVDLNDKKEVKILDGAFYDVSYTNDDNYLYLATEDMTLHRISLVNGEDSVLADRAVQPLIYGDKVYYQYIFEDNWCLNSININGADKATVLDDVLFFSIYNDKIYYTTASYPRKTCICNIDGSNSKDILNDSANLFILPESEKILINSSSDFSYKIMQLDGSDIKDFNVPQIR